MFKLTLTRKLFGILFIYSAIIIFIIIFAGTFLANFKINGRVDSFDNKFLFFAKENAEKFYAEHGSWELLKSNQSYWESFFPKPEIDRIDSKFHFRKDEFPASADFLISRSGLLDKNGVLIAGTGKHSKHILTKKLTHNKELIGYIFLERPDKFPNPVVHDVIENIFKLLAFMGVIALMVSGVAAFFISRHFLKPVLDLINATHKIASKDFSSRVSTKRRDELGLLSEDFNTMSERLSHYEEMRKQWISDIAHELRTPLSVLQAEIEALQDNIRPTTPEALERLHKEVKYLTKTVNNLHTISVAESRGLMMTVELVKPLEILKNTLLGFAEKMNRKQLSFQVDFDNSEAALIEADAYLLKQVFTNIIENSIRYTDASGKIHVQSFLKNNWLFLVFDDSPPGVPEELMEKIFDRLFRVDSSRSREFGGSGLGLSICKTHVESMKGLIKAGSSPLGGLRITVEFPVAGRNR